MCTKDQGGNNCLLFGGSLGGFRGDRDSTEAKAEGVRGAQGPGGTCLGRRATFGVTTGGMQAGPSAWVMGPPASVRPLGSFLWRCEW